LKNTLPGLVLSDFNRSFPPPEPEPPADPDPPPATLPPLDAGVTAPPELGSPGSCAAAPAVAQRIVVDAIAASVAERPLPARGFSRALHPFFALAFKPSLLFPGPTGLAVGLALKELRYGPRSDSPLGLWPLGPPLPGAWGTGNSASFMNTY
jgi:hypothetical protein